ncbi:MAG TPA: aldo/keto reductase family protein, partial [Chloroflexota bacterium]|nr:aldo/keto reductase family protein [Chloroflexota bacterium]
SLGSWLTYGGTVEDNTAIACIHRAYELGINLFDTANQYGKGDAERIVGRALKDFRRDSYLVATKVFFPLEDGPNDKGLSRKHIMEQCHASLRRLGVEYIDLYQCHRYDPETELEETLRALDDLVTQGKVLYLGVSEWSAGQIDDAIRMARALNLDRIVSNQPIYNLLTRAIEPEIMPLCAREGVGQIVYSPLAQGVLTGKYQPSQSPAPGTRASDPESNMFMRGLLSQTTLATALRLKGLADEAGYPLARMALAWVLRHPIVSSAITGASRPQQVEENVLAAGTKLPADLLARIDEILGKVE